MTKGWFYQLPVGLVLALAISNTVLAAEWAIYNRGFQMPSLLGTDADSLNSLVSASITPRSLMGSSSDRSSLSSHALDSRHLLTEAGFFYGELPDLENPTTTEVDELIGPAGVYLRVRF